MGNGKVVIASCYGDIRPPFHESVIATALKHGRTIITAHQGLTSSPRVAAARNELVAKFLARKDKPEFLWMLDADMIFHEDDIVQLRDTAREMAKQFPDTPPIVSGLYFGGRVDGPQKPWAMRIVKFDEDDPRYVEGEREFALRAISGVSRTGEVADGDFPDDMKVRVDAVGAGCLFMHRDALAQIGEHYGPTGQPWFAETGRGDEFGEDITFCLRARSIGIPIWLDCGVKLGHEKPGIVDHTSYKRYLGKLADGMTDEDLNNEFIYRRRVTQMYAPLTGVSSDKSVADPKPKVPLVLPGLEKKVS